MSRERSGEVDRLAKAPAKAKVVAALVEGLTVEQASVATGVPKNRILYWKANDDEFNEMLETVSEEVVNGILDYAVESVRNQIKNLGPKAIENIRAALDSEDERLAFQAAIGVLRLGPFESKDMNVRIGLEQYVNTLPDTQGD